MNPQILESIPTPLLADGEQDFRSGVSSHQPLQDGFVIGRLSHIGKTSTLNLIDNKDIDQLERKGEGRRIEGSHIHADLHSPSLCIFDQVIDMDDLILKHQYIAEPEMF
ncbi:hypothetical protein DSECCO2_530630 [anaerobic digester metagenome]